MTILSGGRFNDKHINFTHQILKKQFPNLTGLQLTLLLSRSQQMPTTTTSPYLQIIHTNGNHWIVASTIGCSPKIRVYDSLHTSLQNSTLELKRRQYGINACVEMGNSPQQVGTTDCGVYAIATCTALVSGSEPGELTREELRHHLVECFENAYLLPFP